MDRLFFNHPPTPTGGHGKKMVFFYHMRIHQTPKTPLKPTSKKHLYFFNKYFLVKVNKKVLLLFYFCSTFTFSSSLLLFFLSKKMEWNGMEWRCSLV